MHCRLRTLTIALTTATAGAAITAATAGRPAVAQTRLSGGPSAGPSAALAPGGDGRYQLQALPGGSREWVVLDTQTGKLQHWSTDSEHYVVTTLEPGLKPGAGIVREVLNAPPPKY